MLALFFAFVLVCAFFFAIGFSLGRRTATAGAGSAARALRLELPQRSFGRRAAKNDAPQPTPQSGDFSFYKAVGEKNADTALTPPDSKAHQRRDSGGLDAGNCGQRRYDAATPAPASGGYYVQVAAVSRQEDAEALVEALKKKQYPAFTANNPSADKFYHVQVGPYADLKEAEAMRARLIGDGYNPIVKK